MNKSFTKQYLQTYVWHGLSVLLSITSMMIVIPMISSNKTLFGIYSICISTSIFLSYADLGFVSAGIKYAGEYYAKKDSNKEIQLYGFTGLVLFVFVSIISVIYLYLSFHPNILIKDLNDPLHLLTAGKLLLIQAIFSYNTVLQRFTEGVFQVRIQQYIFQRISIIGSTFKIASNRLRALLASPFELLARS